MIITLTTDFGLADAYVASMKGVILGINPEVKLVDISHQIEPQNVAQAALLLHTIYKYFPPDTIHLAVVDPGVGTSRHPIALATPQAMFIAPDNGLLSYIIDDFREPSASTLYPETELQETKLPPSLKAFHLNNSQYWRHPISNTFHGRDIFAPVAAHLSLGVPLLELGELIPSLLVFPIPHPQSQANGSLLGHIQHIDTFGNLISDVHRSNLPHGKVVIDIAGYRIEELSNSYAAGKDLVALIGSSGYLEIALKNGSAAKRLGVRVGDSIIIQIPPSPL